MSKKSIKITKDLMSFTLGVLLITFPEKVTDGVIIAIGILFIISSLKPFIQFLEAKIEYEIKKIDNDLT